jgi:aerobic C4-dicarboxylate transport protein
LALSPVSDQGQKPHKSSLYLQVLIAIVAGVALGHFYPLYATELKPLGDAFIKLVKMIIAPVIFLTIVTGITGMQSLKSFGSIALKAFIYFFFFSTLALVVGLVVANVIRPGDGLNIDPKTLDAKAIEGYASKSHEMTLVGFLTDIIPNTMTSAFVDGNILQVLLISILTGLGLSMAGERARPAISLIESLSSGLFKVVDIIMKFAPLGAFGAMAFTVGKYGLAILAQLGTLVASFYGTSLIFIIVILGFVSLLAGFNIFRLISYIWTEILLVLGTSSSESALPKLMEKLEAAGCKRSVVGLVVPTGYSFNLDGTNIYMTLAALFIAQATNTPLSLEQQLTLLVVAMISSKGAAGVTGAGFITLAATLSVVPTVPIAGMALILGIDRFMSECRALTNFIGNAVATVVVARWHGALDRATLKAVLHGKPPPQVAAAEGPLGGPAGLQKGESDPD